MRYVNFSVKFDQNFVDFLFEMSGNDDQVTTSHVTILKIVNM